MTVDWQNRITATILKNRSGGTVSLPESVMGDRKTGELIYHTCQEIITMNNELKQELQKLILNKIKFNNGCWEWQGYVNIKGYGQIHHRLNGKKRRTITVHRISYLAFNGEWDENLVIDHVCSNRKCVNPSHLEQVTLAENTKRGIKSLGKALNNGYGDLLERTHCFKNHELTPQNTYFMRSKPYSKRCKECRRIVKRKYYALHRDIINARARTKYKNIDK